MCEGDEREGARPSSVTSISIEGTGGQAICVLAKEPDVVAVREQFLMYVDGEIGPLVDDHAHAGRG